jgi:hypothetical protein
MQCKDVEVVLEQEGWTPLPEPARVHLSECHSCKNLVADLTSIVAAAHLLPAEVEPPPRVWSALRVQLENEGIIKDAAAVSRTTWWEGFSDLFRTRAMAAATIGLLIIGAVILQFQGPGAPPTEARNSFDETSSVLSVDEAQLSPIQMAGQSVVDASLRKNLDIVDNFIVDCEHRVKEQPQDDLAREYLSGAYQQKAELLSAMMDRQGSGK